MARAMDWPDSASEKAAAHTSHVPGSYEGGEGSVGLVLEGSSLLLFVLTGFCASWALVALSCLRLPGSLAVNFGVKMRRLLVIGLLFASVARCIAIATVFSLQRGLFSWREDLEPKLLKWVEDLLWLVPSVFYLSAFSLVGLLWAQVHYIASMSPPPHLHCGVLLANAGVYLVLVALAVGTFCLPSLRVQLRGCLLVLVGAVNIVVAFFISYYGFQVWNQLADTAKKRLPENRISFRILALSAGCPLLLLACGIYDIGYEVTNGHPKLFVDVGMCVVGEWMPSVVALCVLNPLQQSGENPVDLLGDSTDSEHPLLQDDATSPQMSLSDQGVTWKQLYPQPGAAA